MQLWHVLAIVGAVIVAFVLYRRFAAPMLAGGTATTPPAVTGATASPMWRVNADLDFGGVKDGRFSFE